MEPCRIGFALYNALVNTATCLEKVATYTFRANIDRAIGVSEMNRLGNSSSLEIALIEGNVVSHCGFGVCGVAHMSEPVAANFMACGMQPLQILNRMEIAVLLLRCVQSARGVKGGAPPVLLNNLRA